MVFGQEWPVPADQSANVNPSSYIIENVRAGKVVYERNCKSCHGDPGKNNPLALDPLPVDIASERMQANTDGGLFYKISTGRGLMPPFSGSVSEDDRWKLVNFIRNYRPGTEPILVDAPPVKAKLLASVNEENATVEILAEYEKGSTDFSELADAPIIISSKKAFGNMEIGQILTNENGRAEFRIPENVIGDEEGFISIVVSLDEGYDAPAVTLEKARVGKQKEVPSIIRDQVLWSTNDNIQTWLLVSFIVAAVGAWLVILYVIAQLAKIKKYSKV
jgi:mono/diheme cytochrome c family protein